MTATEVFSLLANLRLPADKQTNRKIIDKLVRALVGVVLFQSAYVAEVVRA